MKITSTKELPNGTTRITVELAAGEKLIAVRPNSNYRLGYQIDDIIFGTAIMDAVEVSWCQIEQNWIS